MKTTLVIKGRVPSLKNSRRAVCRYGKAFLLSNERYLAWRTDAIWQLRTQKAPVLTQAKHIQCVIYAPDNREGDLSNKWQSVEEVLVDAGVLPDDNWFVIQNVSLSFGGVNKEKAGAEIIIEV